MKIRLGFVSNSSSSSFVISRDHLFQHQLDMIVDHGNKVDDSADEWEITVSEEEVRGFTWMDNFDMQELLESIGVHPEHIAWGD